MRTLLNLGTACYRWTHHPTNISTVRRIVAGVATVLVVLLVLACAAPGTVPIASGGAVGTAGWPVPPGTAISRGYGCHSFYTGTRGNCPAGMWWHNGIDFTAAQGTPLFAVFNGSILYAGADTGSMDCSWMAGSQAPHIGYGLYVRATDGAGLTADYGHVISFNVTGGQQVVATQHVAGMGSTGCSTAPHTHFTMRRNGLDINPMDVLQQP